MKCCVLISSYNGENCIIEQLDTIKNQTRKVDAVFVCDDCSKDNTYSLVKEYIKTNKLINWKATINSKNKGWKANYFNAIKKVPKDFDVIFLCDQDDIWSYNKVEEVMDYYEKNKYKGLVTSDLFVQYESERAKKINHIKIDGKLRIIPKNINTLRPGCCMAFDREMAQDCMNNIFDESLPHDMALWMYFYCKDYIYNINEQLIKWRRFEDSTTFFDKNGNRLNHKIDECNEMITALTLCKGIKGINNEVQEILNNCLKLQYLKLDLFENKRIISWIKCFKYIDYYPSIKRWFGDLFFTIIS